MSASRRIVVTLVAVVVVLAGIVYLALPLLWHERAELACQTTIPGDGGYTVEWRPVPLAHWECVSTPAGEPSRTSDLGWWPTGRQTLN
jgi:hypothetical protein